MIVTFDVTSEKEDIFRVVLSSGKDAFFAADDILPSLEVEIVEIDLERVRGTHPASLKTLVKIADGIAKFFAQDERAVLYYYCDDTTELPAGSSRHLDFWPQEYRSQLFSRMFQMHVMHHHDKDEVADITIQIMQGNRPIIMHLITRVIHMRHVEVIKDYILQNYGK